MDWSTLLPLLFGLLGGLLVKAADWLVARNAENRAAEKQEFEIGKTLREELRVELDRTRDRLDDLERKNAELAQINTELALRVATQGEQLRGIQRELIETCAERDQLKWRVGELETQLQKLQEPSDSRDGRNLAPRAEQSD